MRKLILIALLAAGTCQAQAVVDGRVTARRVELYQDRMVNFYIPAGRRGEDLVVHMRNWFDQKFPGVEQEFNMDIRPDGTEYYTLTVRQEGEIVQLFTLAVIEPKTM